jgi:hypothetical protein
MTMTTAEATIIAAGTSVPFGYTEASPASAGVGAVVGPFADYADSFAYRINNGSPAPGSPVVIVFYAVVNPGANQRLYEIDRVSGDALANSSASGVIPIPGGYGSFTAKAFGNTSQNVTVEVFLERQVP